MVRVIHMDYLNKSVKFHPFGEGFALWFVVRSGDGSLWEATDLRTGVANLSCSGLENNSTSLSDWGQKGRGLQLAS